MAFLKRLLMVAVIVASFSCVTSGFLRSLKHRNVARKRSHSDEEPELGPTLYFKGRPLQSVTKVSSHGSVVLECQASGSPGPTIHWLKDGERIQQGESPSLKDDEAVFEDTKGKDGLPLLGLSSTKSKLFLDCLSPVSEGEYTCVAETPFSRISQSTIVKVESGKYKSFENCIVKKSLIRGEPARIYLWTSNRLEFQDNKVQLYCRADGFPKPEITWYDVEGNKIKSGHDYRIAENGDLIIRDINWMNMGVYTCIAKNGVGRDIVDTFLYPIFRDDEEESLNMPVY